MIIRVPADDGSYCINYFDLGRMQSGKFVTIFDIKGVRIVSASSSGEPNDRFAQAKIDLAPQGIDLGACFILDKTTDEIYREIALNGRQ